MSFEECLAQIIKVLHKNKKKGKKERKKGRS